MISFNSYEFRSITDISYDSSTSSYTLPISFLSSYYEISFYEPFGQYPSLLLSLSHDEESEDEESHSLSRFTYFGLW